jgi:hypothetical protein
MISESIRKEIEDAVRNAWHFCGSWVEHVGVVMADHGLIWDAEADRIINEIAINTLTTLTTLTKNDKETK